MIKVPIYLFKTLLRYLNEGKGFIFLRQNEVQALLHEVLGVVNKALLLSRIRFCNEFFYEVLADIFIIIIFWGMK